MKTVTEILLKQTREIGSGFSKRFLRSYGKEETNDVNHFHTLNYLGSEQVEPGGWPW